MKERVTTAFEQQFGKRPSHIIRAPGRVNLIGEHTDYNDGFVLPMAIDRAVWLAVRPREDERVLAYSLEQPRPADFTLENLRHTNSGWAEYVKGMSNMLQDAGYRLSGWEGVLTSDVPVGSGLSSSAALEMAVGCAFATVSNFRFDGKEMPKLGQKTENEWVGANTGIMDQMISANGQAGYALLIDCRDLSTQSIPLPTETAVLVMDTMTRHSHTESGYNERRQQCEAAATYFGVSALRNISITEFLAHEAELEPLIRQRARHVITENLRTLNAAKAMQNDDAPLLGQLMNESHSSLRDDFEVTNDELDIMARLAQAQPGCYGARMTGGGFGGCAVALVQAEAAAEIGTAVATQYKAATNLNPNIYITKATNGTSVI